MRVKFLSLLVFTAMFSVASLNAQAPREPNQQKLLNGLKVLIWSDANTPKITAKIRIHSGSAFDPKNRSGVMALLADILFPGEQTREFFRDELDGSLEVVSNYDYIQIDASGKSEEFLSMMETLANAVSNPQITPDNFAKVRNERVKLVGELNKNPDYIADRAAAKRLFGEFPYGRPPDGTIESLKLIDRPDLIFAKERFLTADNATLTISGNIKSDIAYRTVRRLFGAWKKSEGLIPASFRVPEPPITDPFTFEADGISTTQIRVAARGFARNDNDFMTVKMLVKLFNQKLPPLLSAEFRNSAAVKNESFLLPGFLSLGLTTSSTDISKCGEEAHKVSLIRDLITPADFERAKSEVQREFSSAIADPLTLPDLWLDADTYKLAPIKDQLRSLSALSLSDLLRVNDRLLSATLPKVFVIVVPKKQSAAASTNP